jgi:hypothetical protein
VATELKTYQRWAIAAGYGIRAEVARILAERDKVRNSVAVAGMTEAQRDARLAELKWQYVLVCERWRRDERKEAGGRCAWAFGGYMRHTAAWKQHERRVAAAIGGVRLGATGRENPDVVSDDGHTVCECKHRATLPAWLKGPLSKVRSQAGPDAIGLLVLHELGSHDSLVVVSLKDWVAWYGPVPAELSEPAHSGAPG